jgi:hypothetical protein
MGHGADPFGETVEHPFGTIKARIWGLRTS